MAVPTPSKIVAIVSNATLSNLSSYFLPGVKWGSELVKNTNTKNINLPYFNHAMTTKTTTTTTNPTAMYQNETIPLNNHNNNEHSFLKNIQHLSDVFSSTIITKDSMDMARKNETSDPQLHEIVEVEESSAFENLSVWLISTLKRRKKKMNKHKLRKRRKLLRLKSKK